MSERRLRGHRATGLRCGRIEPLSPQAWQRVEAALFARLDAAPAGSRAALARSTGANVIHVGRLRERIGSEPR